MTIRIFGVLALLANLSFPSLVEAGPHVRVFDGVILISRYADDEVYPLGIFTLDDINDDPIREFPWQVSLSFDRNEVFDPNFPHTIAIDFTVTILNLNTTLLIEENLSLNFQEIHASLDDGDLDLFLVNAPGGDNSVRFGGVLSAAHVPEPSTLAILLLATLFAPLSARAARNRNG